MAISFQIPEIPTSASDKRYWCHLHHAARAYAISEAVKSSEKFCLVICDTTAAANELEAQVRFFTQDTQVLHFPDWETLPYDSFSPHQDIVSDRLRCLHTLSKTQSGVLFVPINTLMQKVAPRPYIASNNLHISIGDEVDPELLRLELQASNYQCVETVYEHGEFAIRGGIVDLFPMGNDYPFRIELFDIEVEGIKRFNPDTQLTVDKVKSIDVLPAREFPIDKAAIERFKDQWYQYFEDTSIKEAQFYEDLNQGIMFSGIEYYLPLFHEELDSLLDHIPSDSLIITTDAVEANCRLYWQEIQNRYEQYGIDRTRPLLPPDALFSNEQALFGRIKAYPRIIVTDQPHDNPAKGFFNLASGLPIDLSIDAHATSPYSKLQEFISSSNSPLLFCAETLGRKDALQDIFKACNIGYQDIENWQAFVTEQPSIGLTVSPISQGMSLEDCDLVAESQLFGNRVQQRRRRRQNKDNTDVVIKSLTELKPNAAVVHIDHGIGRYLGLKVIELDGEKNEFLTLKYADEAMLYVPVASLHLISRYTGGDDEHAPLHRLGTDQWSKAKRKAAEKVNDVAAELLDIYARRAARKGFAHATNSGEYLRFAANFPFEETDDQSSAISAVLRDMHASTPMDRLVCGDVGFGKTEVAMRAAFTAVNNSKQVGVLVPTTLLAQQHYESFVDRFADMAINVEVLSRFKTAKQQQQVIEKLESGQVDILIGTHKLLQADVKFNNLGLVIIDEEHRFGVKQKDSLKSLRAQVDVLALTATPIPRTLNMSMAGIRDLSIIATPPAKRLSIKTFVKASDDNLLKEAILRELLRGGQVYYLHNDVKTIEKTAADLAALVPEARIGIGHGQMRERELERVMSDFYHKRFNLLVCTTIIETGIDVPTANTIIIDRADKFGLAQLHQLRGRVGRSHHQAYAYMLIPAEKKLSKDAEKRLNAIEEATDLGAGFTLATHDLEIRGAGELLGDDQSGQIQTVGYSLYMEMLDKAVKSIQRGETPNIDQPLRQGTEINLHISAIIPDDYLPDVHNRLIMYKSIANSANDDELRDIKVQMIDRFGLLPQQINHLFDVTSLKLRAESLGIVKITANQTNGRIEFAEDTQIDPLKLVKMVQSAPNMFSFDGATALKYQRETEDAEQRTQWIGDILEQLEA
ncbi:Transcription-repair-coupling factor [BD1-7 clade bacterium]|uniref:Transcription-repair-coupling factor n=1 Tax=BD1-7 clade bacterium TaxID=2029982 RepID=A0A5S9PXC7_9GAMM|nr:Transcription-repair-coupling factor [BD1-7 clade bacterium]